MSASADLRRLLAEATPGPWEAVEQTEWEDAYIRQQEDGAPGETMVAENLRQFDGADAPLIVYLANHADDYLRLLEREPLVQALIDAAKKAYDANGEHHASGDAAMVAALASLEGTTDERDQSDYEAFGD